MNILIINGSPKGDYSITLQTSKYLELLNPQHNFSYLNAAQGIKAFERDFTKAADAVKNADFKIAFDPTLVRGMSYYTGPIFEISMDEFGGSVGGGGTAGKFGNCLQNCRRK